MKDRILEIIPDRNDIERILKLAEEYGAVFEYNDFMVPPQTEDADKRRETVAFYRSLGRDLSQDTPGFRKEDLSVYGDGGGAGRERSRLPHRAFAGLP